MTQYLRDTCQINLVISKSTDKHRGFAFITIPDHVHDELLKLNDVKYKGRPIVVETAKSRSGHQNQATQNEANTEFFYQPKKNIVLFCDSIPRGIMLKELNQKTNRGRIHLKAFPGARAQHLKHYLVPSLEEYEYDCAIIHLGINDILRHNDENELRNFPEDTLRIANSCRNHNINKVFVSSILPSLRTSIDIEKINNELKNLCFRNGFEFIYHQQITTSHLWEDGVHLTNRGKSILANNFVTKVNNFYNIDSDFLMRRPNQPAVR